jgi:hypothetical protein
MGGNNSKSPDSKSVDLRGVANNMTVTKEKGNNLDVEIVILLSIIAFVQLIQLGIYCYTQHIKKIKKTVRNESRC